jgi:hypothetical protein
MIAQAPRRWRDADDIATGRRLGDAWRRALVTPPHLG